RGRQDAASIRRVPRAGGDRGLVLRRPARLPLPGAMAVEKTAPAPGAVPRSFRRESRLFLWVALILILFLNLLTLRFFRAALDWGADEVARGAGEILRRVALSSGRGDAGEETLERAALEPDVAYVALYDANGRRVRALGPGPVEAPPILEQRP